MTLPAKELPFRIQYILFTYKYFTDLLLNFLPQADQLHPQAADAAVDYQVEETQNEAHLPPVSLLDIAWGEEGSSRPT